MPAVETFKNVPEFFEGIYEESIKMRTETLSTFKQLGPDDLVHVVKSIPNSRQQIKEVSSYHFVRGVDISSSASVAAYINSLTYSLESNQTWRFGNQGNSWNISKCTFCAFNAFSGTDFRVEARIPGGVKSFVVDAIGIKKGTDQEGWQEVFLSSILRSLKPIIFNPDKGEEEESDTFEATRCLDGLFTLQTEMKFLETATKLFSKGRQLGSPFGPQLAGNHDNYLTLGVVNYFCITGRPEISMGFLKPFAEKDPSLKGLMLKCLLKSKNQGLALGNISKSAPPCDQIADFLISRGDLVNAEHFASEAIKSAPTSFPNWERLVKIKIATKQHEKALTILNNSPMSAYPESEFYKSLPKPVLTSLPGTCADGNEGGSNLLTILEKLKSTKLRGTFKSAYNLLIEIYKSVGWEGLLECRSEVFVMEKEYITADTTAINDGIVGGEDPKDVILKSPLEEPVHFVSLASTDFLSKTGKKLCERWLDNLILILFEDLRIFELFSEELKRKKESNLTTGIAGKDNKSVKEWLLLGKLSERLGHLEESKLAYQKCLFTPSNTTNSSFNHYSSQRSALNSLIRIYCQEGKAQLALLCSIRLLTCQERIYTSTIHPTQMSTNLCGLIGKIGLARVRADLRAIKEQQAGGVWEKLDGLLQFLKDAKIHGYDY